MSASSWATFEDKRRLPAWVTNFEATKFDSTESISRIRQIGLQPNRAILATIIFQKGSGRKEEALLRGLREIAGKAVAPAWRLKFNQSKPLC